MNSKVLDQQRTRQVKELWLIKFEARWFVERIIPSYIGLENGSIFLEKQEDAISITPSYPDEALANAKADFAEGSHLISPGIRRLRGAGPGESMGPEFTIRAELFFPCRWVSLEEVLGERASLSVGCTLDPSQVFFEPHGSLVQKIFNQPHQFPAYGEGWGQVDIPGGSIFPKLDSLSLLALDKEMLEWANV